MNLYRFQRLTSALSVAVLAHFLGACNDSTEPFPPEATFTGQWAGERWLGEAYAVLVDGGDEADTLFIGGSRPVDAGSMPLESIRIRVLFHGPGTYALGSSSGDRAELYEIIGGDVVSAIYSTTSARTGTLLITSYEGPGGVIEGQVSFVGVSDSQYRSYGAVASFVNGQFRATVDTYP